MRFPRKFEARKERMPEAPRQPHAVLDAASRQRKGLKIERLLDLSTSATPLRLLEIGTGSGAIAHYFAHHPTLRCDVHAVDVVDQRLAANGYAFELVNGTSLPFHDRTFDVVLSNHVIEHVGDRCQQARHLAEIARVMKRDARGYLAVPNRWMLVEPHYRLPFLTWLPRNLRSTYLRLCGKGRFYDCEPLATGQAEELIGSAGLEWRNVCVEALRLTMQIEGKAGFQARLANALSDRTLEHLLPVFPTLCYTFRRSETGSA